MNGGRGGGVALSHPSFEMLSKYFPGGWGASEKSQSPRLGSRRSSNLSPPPPEYGSGVLTTKTYGFIDVKHKRNLICIKFGACKLS